MTLADKFLYVRVAEPNSSRPIDSYVSSCPDEVENPRSEENPYLYTYDETQGHDHDHWIRVAVRNGYWLNVDIDVGDDHAAVIEFDWADLNVTDDVMITRTPSGGWHLDFFFQEDPGYIDIPVEGIDTQGNIDGNLGLAGSPFHSGDYELVNDGWKFWDHEFRTGEINRVVSVDNFRDLFVLSAEERETLDIEIPDDAPDSINSEVMKLFEVRQSNEVAGQQRHMANTYIAIIMLSQGYDAEEVNSAFAEYPDPDGYDQNETLRQLEYLSTKVENGDLLPPSPSTIERKCGVDIDTDVYPFYTDSLDVSDFVPQTFTQDPYTDATPHQHMTVTSSARAGKSTKQTQAAADVVRNTDKKVLQVVGMHTDGLEQLSKWHRQGIRPVYLLGREKARELGCPTGDQNFTSADVRTPEDCKDHPHLNTVTALEQRANDDDIQVVITVAQKLDALNLDDFDLFISSEEDPLTHFWADSINLVKCIQVRGTDRAIESHPNNIRDKLHDFIDEMDSRDQLDKEWRQLITAARALDDCCEMIEDWSPGNWNQVEKSWQTLHNRLEIRLTQMAFEEPPDEGDLWTRVQNQSVLNEIGEMLMHTVFYRTLFPYQGGQKKQLFIVSDWDRLYMPDISHMTFWLSGNNLPFLQRFHKLAHGNVPTPRAFRGEHQGIDQMRLLKFTGGDNPNQQSRAIQNTVEQIQNTRPTSNLVIAGSSDYTAKLAERIPRSWRPTSQDSVADLRAMANPGSSTIAAENSSHSEGIDTGFFEMGALYNGRFATPVEDAMADSLEDDKYVIAEWIRAAQNAALRPCNTLDDNTGVTPVMVPDRHVPDEMFEILEQYGIQIVEVETIEEMRTTVVEMLKMDMEGIIVDDAGRIARRQNTDVNAFEMLRRQQTSSSGETH